MKKIMIILAALAVSATTAMAADRAEGLWMSAPNDKGAYIHVEISPCGDRLCGVIVDVINSDNRSSVGKDIILDMKIGSNGKYSGGTIWAPDTDKTYKSRMAFKGETLIVKGCIGGFKCRGQNWTRVN